MAKVLEAVVQNGVVKVGSLSVPEAVIFSEGLSNSQGVLLLEESGAYYIPKTSPDLNATLEQLLTGLQNITQSLTEVSTALTAIAAVPSGWVTPPPTIAANVAIITTKVAAITAARTALNTLKGALK